MIKKSGKSFEKVKKLLNDIKVPAIFAALSAVLLKSGLLSFFSRFAFLARFAAGSTWLATAAISGIVFLVGIASQYGVQVQKRSKSVIR